MSAVLSDEAKRRKQLRRRFFWAFFIAALCLGGHYLPQKRDEALASIKPCPPLKLQAINPTDSVWERSKLRVENSLVEIGDASFGCRHDVEMRIRTANRIVPLGFFLIVCNSIWLLIPAHFLAKARVRRELRLMELKLARDESRERRQNELEDALSQSAAAALHSQGYRNARRAEILKIIRLAINDFEYGSPDHGAMPPDGRSQQVRRRQTARTSLTQLVAKYSEEQLAEVMRDDRTVREAVIDLEQCLTRLQLESDASVRSLRFAAGRVSLLRRFVA